MVTPLSETVAGEAYVKAITARESDRNARADFQSIVLKIARPGAAIFDFGAGPGIDARFYAERGFTVGAYDVDAKMCEFFLTYCREFVRTGRIKLERGDYQAFLSRGPSDDGSRFDLVTANFAPFNLIDDLHELFATLHSLVRPEGQVLASILNPYYIGDLKYRWWWRNVPSLCRTGHYSVQGGQAPIVRRRLDNFAAQCRPYFALECVFRRTPVHQFTFLLFRKQT